MDAARALEPRVSDLAPASLAAVNALPAFEQIYEQYVNFVWASLQGLGVPAAALDDAVQEVFVVLHRRLPDFEGRSTLKTFLFGIAVGVGRNQRRAAARTNRLDTLEEAEQIPDTRPSPLEQTTTTQALGRLSRILDQLDDAKREVLILVEWEQMTAPEIAEVLGIPLNTVYSRLRLARAEFERLLQRERGEAT
jgi:RNA polymerase sigma-70 factor (ECF subfamily)